MEDVYVMAGEEIQMVCKVLAYPQAEITWSFQPCQDLSLWPSCRKERIQTVSSTTGMLNTAALTTNHFGFACSKKLQKDIKWKLRRLVPVS